MKKYICLFCSSFFLLLTQHKATAQSLLAADSTLLYSTGEGTFLKLGKAEGTKFNVLTTIQSGFQQQQLDTGGLKRNSNRLSLNLVRVALNVTALKDKLTAGIVTDFTGTSPILEGWIGLSVLNKHGNLIIGQRQTHTNNRLAMADERYAQTMGQLIEGKSIDGSAVGGLVKNFVGATREGGLFFETNFNLNKWRIYPSVSITTGEGQNFFDAQPNVGFKYGGRLDVLPLGNFIKNNAFIAHDIYKEPKPKIAFGIAGSFNAKAASPIGSDNAGITGIFNNAGVADFANYRKLVADFMYKHNGFSFVAEYVNTTVAGKELYTNIAATNKLTENLASGFYNIGSALNFQTAFVGKKGFTVDARFTSITPEFSTTTSLVKQQQWYSVGATKYLKNNAVKIGINATYITENTIIKTVNQWVSNIALQILL